MGKNNVRGTGEDWHDHSYNRWPFTQGEYPGVEYDRWICQRCLFPVKLDRDGKCPLCGREDYTVPARW